METRNYIRCKIIKKEIFTTDRRFHLGRVSSPEKTMFRWFYSVNHIDHLLRSQNGPIWCCDRWKSNAWQQRRRDHFEWELWSAQSFYHVIFKFCRCKKHHNPSNWLCRQSSISVTGWNDLSLSLEIEMAEKQEFLWCYVKYLPQKSAKKRWQLRWPQNVWRAYAHEYKVCMLTSSVISSQALLLLFLVLHAFSLKNLCPFF